MPMKRTKANKEQPKKAVKRNSEVVPHGVKRTKVLKEPKPVVAPEPVAEEPSVDEERREASQPEGLSSAIRREHEDGRSVLIVNGVEFPIAEPEPENVVEPEATEPTPTKPKKAKVRETTTKVTKPKTTKAKVSKSTRVNPGNLYDEEDFAEFEMLAEDFISAHDSLTGYMDDHGDPAYKMLNRAHPNFVRSLVTARQPK